MRPYSRVHDFASGFLVNYLHGFVRGEEHLAAYFLCKCCPDEPIHHGPFDFGKVKLDRYKPQAFIDASEHFEPRGIDEINGAADKKDVLCFSVSFDDFQDAIFHAIGVSEIKTFVDAHGNDLRPGFCLVAFDISKVSGVA